MKKSVSNIITVLIFLLVLIVLFFFFKNSFFRPKKTAFVSYNGNLHINGNSLYNKYNEVFQLKGVSSHGIQWFYDVITNDNLQQLKDNYNVNVFRIAMYTEEDGYIQNPIEMKEKVFKIIDTCIDLDLYIILDWHILKDGDPNTHIQEAGSFFDEISLKYKNTPNILYEICNEPNCENIGWEKVKDYANYIIPIIRKNSSKSIIIVGTPNWCKNIMPAADDPLNYKNVMYSCHFYSGTDFKELQYSIDYALNKNIPIFVTEWGTTDLSGDGVLSLNIAKNWINFLNERNISWINWSFSNKNESSAILNSNFSATTPSNISDYLTPSGEFVLNEILGNK